MTVYHLAHGGLGNRLFSLQSAISLARLLETKLLACWPVNDECGLAFKKIFDTDIEEIESPPCPDKGFVRLGIIPGHIREYPQFDHVEPIILVPMTEDEKFLKSLRHVDVYFSDWVDRKFTAFHPLKFKDEYIQKANDFVLKNNIGITLHIRATDSGYKPNVLDYMKTCSEEMKRICYYKGKPRGNMFVTSDEQKYEEEFSRGPMRVVRTDKKWPTKRDDAAPFRLGEGLYNIRRSEDQVVEAIIDMLIMSKTSYIYANTYSSLAKYAQRLYQYENPETVSRYLDTYFEDLAASFGEK